VPGVVLAPRTAGVVDLADVGLWRSIGEGGDGDVSWNPVPPVAATTLRPLRRTRDLRDTERFGPERAAELLAEGDAMPIDEVVDIVLGTQSPAA
jgi:hypothetical protein